MPDIGIWLPVVLSVAALLGVAIVAALPFPRRPALPPEPRLTAQAWRGALAEPDQPLTVAEFAALEQSHAAAALTAIARHVERLDEGRADRLELFLIDLSATLRAAGLPIPAYVSTQEERPVDDLAREALDAAETERQARTARYLRAKARSVDVRAVV